MTEILLNLFVPNVTDPENATVRSRIGTLSGIVGIVCNFLLFAGKLFAGTVTGALSITADALNNLSDASGSVVTLLGFRLAEKPADEDHPYGHARFEYLTALAVAVMILFIGFELAKSSVSKILNPQPVNFSPLAAAILVFSIVLKLWLCLFNRRLASLIGSNALYATSADSRNDCIATTAVLTAALVQHFFSLRVDGIMGLGVAVFILYSGISLARDTISPLLGENGDPQLRCRLEEFISAQPKVLGYHDLMIHDYGPGQRFASIHVEMDHREDPLVCHAIIDHMEHTCLKNFNLHLVIHYDPIITDDPELNRLQGIMTGFLTEYDYRLSLHDFRMIPGNRHINLLFDITLPMELRDQEEQITAMLEQRLQQQEQERYHLLITFDLAFS